MLVALEVTDGSTSAAPDDDVRDGGTIELFGAAMALAAGTSCASLVLRRPVPRRPVAWWAGLSSIWLGAAFNRAAKRHLGRNYRSKLTIVSGHDVVQTGPYRRLRHPMYSGALLICAGAALTVDAPESAVWILPAGALIHRIGVEEKMLRGALGPAYAEFIDGRARVVPNVW